MAYINGKEILFSAVMNGAAEVKTEETTVTPTKEAQEMTPPAGTYFSKVTVEAIPDEYEIPTIFEAALGETVIISSGALITFTMIDNGDYSEYQYQAEEGMTWGEFAASDYNTNNIFYTNSSGIMFYNDVEFGVNSSDEIVPDASYYYGTHSGGGNE